ncbi:unnamed protein product, partial [Prunus brigantina]
SYPFDFTQKTPNDSSHHIMMFPKFWTKSDIDWPMTSDNSGSYELPSKMEWLVYCIVLPIGLTQNPPNASSHQIMLFPKFCTQSGIDWSMKLDNSGSYDVPSEMEWLLYCIVVELDFTENPPNDSSHHIMMFPKFWTQSDIDWSMKLDNSGSFVRSSFGNGFVGAS